jgi:tetratricopeptide (TPR) repeat protein
MNGEDIKEYLKKGGRLNFNGDFDGAIKEYSKAITLDPANIDVYTYRASCYFSNQQFAEAIADMNKVIAMSPLDIDLYNTRGFFYKRNGQNDEAIADYTRILELCPKNRKAYHNRGLAYCDSGQYDKAIGDFTTAIKCAPLCSSWIYKDRGIAYGLKCEKRLAIKDLKKSLRIFPLTYLKSHKLSINLRRFLKMYKFFKEMVNAELEKVRTT